MDMLAYIVQVDRVQDKICMQGDAVSGQVSRVGAQQPTGGYFMRSSSALGCGTGAISSTSCMMRSTSSCICINIRTALLKVRYAFQHWFDTDHELEMRRFSLQT